MALEYSRHISKNINITKSVHLEPKYSVRTDWQTEMTKLKLAFRVSVKAPKCYTEWQRLPRGISVCPPNKFEQIDCPFCPNIYSCNLPSLTHIHADFQQSFPNFSRIISSLLLSKTEFLVFIRVPNITRPTVHLQHVPSANCNEGILNNYSLNVETIYCTTTLTSFHETPVSEV
jgi:hypothetical protein